MTVDDAIDQACSDVGIRPPKHRSYGKWLLTDTLEGRKGKGDGRVIINDHCVTAWNWKTSEKSTVSLRDGLSATEKRGVTASVEKANKKASEDRARAARIANELLAKAIPATHEYLSRKGFPDERVMTVPAQVVRQLGGDYLVPAGATSAVLVPARRAGEVCSAQLIWGDGTKKFLYGGEIGGSSHRIGKGADTWLCEGFATGLSLRNALHGLKMRPTILCCFSAANIAAVARSLPGRVFVAADHDQPRPQFGGVGTGEHYARQTMLPYGMPPDVGTDFNDMHQRTSIFAVQRALTSIMVGRRAA